MNSVSSFLRPKPRHGCCMRLVIIKPQCQPFEKQSSIQNQKKHFDLFSLLNYYWSQAAIRCVICNDDYDSDTSHNRMSSHSFFKISPVLNQSSRESKDKSPSMVRLPVMMKVSKI